MDSIIRQLEQVQIIHWIYFYKVHKCIKYSIKKKKENTLDSSKNGLSNASFLIFPLLAVVVAYKIEACEAESFMKKVYDGICKIRMLKDLYKFKFNIGTWEERFKQISWKIENNLCFFLLFPWRALQNETCIIASDFHFHLRSFLVKRDSFSHFYSILT